MEFDKRLLEIQYSDAHEGEPWAPLTPPAGWQIIQNGLWANYVCDPIPRFGWKLHVSSRIEDAVNVLHIVSSTAYEYRCAFKHLRGADCFRTLHFKNASRLQSGKFIALYPRSASLATETLDRLHRSLRQFQGLDILTDQSYKGSTNVYYRWGAFYGTGRINSLGELEELIPNGYGEMVPDVRAPFFVLPEGIVDPFSEVPTNAARSTPPQSVVLDRFKIDEALRFTNAGGRYKGICLQSGAEVVIKEARPNTGFVGVECAIPRLRREISTLELINSNIEGLAPSVVATFSIDNHEYVALEFIPGTPLSE